MTQLGQKTTHLKQNRCPSYDQLGEKYDENGERRNTTIA